MNMNAVISNVYNLFIKVNEITFIMIYKLSLNNSYNNTLNSIINTH